MNLALAEAAKNTNNVAEKANKTSNFVIGTIFVAYFIQPLNLFTMADKFSYVNPPDRYKVLEEVVDVQVQMEFYTAITKKEKERKNKTLTEEDLIQNEALLYNHFSNTRVKKMALLILATGRDVASYRAIERFANSSKSEGVKNWAWLAKNYAQMVLENTLSSKHTMYVSSGLGGKQDKLRYLVVFIAKDKKEFSPAQQQVIQKEFEFLLPKHACEFESVKYHEKYAVIKCLARLEPDIREVIAHIHSSCNELGNFIDGNYVVTNIKDLSVEEIDAFLKSNNRMDVMKSLK